MAGGQCGHVFRQKIYRLICNLFSLSTSYHRHAKGSSAAAAGEGIEPTKIASAKHAGTARIIAPPKNMMEIPPLIFLSNFHAARSRAPVATARAIVSLVTPLHALGDSFSGEGGGHV